MHEPFYTPEEIRGGFHHVGHNGTSFKCATLDLSTPVFVIPGEIPLGTDAMLRDVSSAAQILGAGTLISLWAGVVEEIAFRWLIFYSAIATVTLGNFLFFGWLGFGFQEWFHMNVWGPVANWTTFGYLKEYIFWPSGNPDGIVSWAVGAAMLSANAFFRDGHKYQGILGVINSWFMGMYFFWLSFRFGLPAAIAIHFAYDFLIFATVAVMTALRQRRIA